MANKVGDMVRASIKRGGFKNVKIIVSRGAGLVNLSLIPSMDGEFTEEEICHEGLDARVSVQYYKQTLKLKYLQSDKDTLKDLYLTAFDSYFHSAGTSTEITFMNGDAITLTMYWRRKVVAPGYNGPMYVELEATSMSAAPAFR